MMNAWELPESLNVGGTDYEIRTDYRVILDILIACNDPELDDREKTIVMCMILYIDFDVIPDEDLQEASEKAMEFIDCGLKDDGKPSPRTMDWEQDAGLIIPAINRVANKEIRTVKYLHWWTFFGLFMEIGESVFSTVQHVRSKRAKGQQLEKWERDFIKENKAIVDLEVRYSAEEEAEKERINKMLG